MTQMDYDGLWSEAPAMGQLSRVYSWEMARRHSLAAGRTDWPMARHSFCVLKFQA
jgi:hypothetical protein